MALPSHIKLQGTWVLLLDLLCLIAGCALGIGLRLGPDEMPKYVIEHVDGWLVFLGSIILANYVAGSYRLEHTHSNFNMVVTWLFSLAWAILVLSVTSYAWFRLLLGRGVLAIAMGGYAMLSLFLRVTVYRGLFRSSLFECRAVIIGCGSQTEDIRKMLMNPWVIPRHRVVGCVEVTPDGAAVTPVEHLRVLDGVAVITSSVSGLDGILRSLGANLIILTDQSPDLSRRIYPQLRRLRFEGVEVLTALAAAETYGGRTPLDLLNEDTVMQAGMESGLPMVARFKRLVDILMALGGLVVLAPVFLLIALVIKVSDPRSPVMYSQLRVGQFGRLFRIHKFRTMRPDAEAGTGPVWAAAGDARITGFGRFLRRFRLDEIPQFVNVLDGDMSIVGPRPERPEIAAELERLIPFYGERSNVMPGLTGWAQIRHPYGNSIEDARRKLEYDLYYIKFLSLSMDLQIILRTIRIVLFGMERAV